MKRIFALAAAALVSLGSFCFHGFAEDVSDTFRQSLFRTEEENLLLHKKLLADKDSIVAVLLKEPSRSQQEDYSGRAVGEIPFEEGITPSGARTYTISIPAASSFNFKPSISLVYNSQAAEGWAGYGWDIQGVPTISIINKNKYYHEIAKGARVSETDSVFALDGVPLVPNDQPGTMSDYPLITVSGNILASPVYNIFGYITSFNVAYPNGVTATFGCEESAFSHQQSYPVTQMTDMDGNIITYTYLSDQSNGTKRLDAIRYGYDSSDNYLAEISFLYSSITGYVSRNYAGKASYHDYRLERIVSKDGNSEIGRFHLFYSREDNVHLLNRIECISGQDSLRPLRFNYGYESLTYLPPEYYLSKGQGRLLLANYAYNTYEYVYKRGKFAYRSNNDGFLMYRKATNYEIINYHTWNGKFYPDYGSPYPSNWKILYAPSVSDFTNMYDTITAGSGFQTIEAVDVDGDGLDELVKVNFNGTTGSNTILRITVYKSADGGAPVQSAQFDITVEGVITSGNEDFPCRREYFWGDFLGNGKVQLATIAYDKNYTLSGPEQNQNSNTVLIDIAGQEKLFDAQLFIFPQNGPQRLIACDLDNDSQTELCYGTNIGLKAYRFNGESFQLERTFMLLTDSVLASDTNPCYVTDLNGDGYIDVMRAPTADSGDSWRRYSFNGSSFSLSYVNLGTREANDTYFFIDLNRDGLADIIKLNGTNVGTIMNLNGSSFSQYQSQAVTISSPRGLIPSNVVDYCGMSSLLMIDGDYAYPFNYARISPEMRRIIKSVDSKGRLSVNSYSFLPQNSRDWCDSTSTIDNSTGFAFKTLPLYVLSGEEKYNREEYPRVKYADKSYWYYDGIIHHLGLGFCGFSKLRSIDSMTSPLEISDYFYNPMKRGVFTKSVIKHNFNGTPYLIITNSYDDHTTTYGKLNPRLTQSVAVDSLTGITTTTSYTYGDYDLPSSVITTRHIGTQPEQSERVNYTYQHSLAPSKYVLGALTQELHIINADANPDSSWRRRTNITYDDLFHPATTKQYVGAHGIPVPVPHDPILQSAPGIIFGLRLVSTTRRTFDSRGNVTSEKTAPYGATEFVGDTLVYDANGRYLLSKTDALGHTTTYSGYNKFGKPTSVTDYSNRSTTYTYDSWGNLTQTSYPDGGVEQTTTAWGGDGLYTVSHTATGEPETITHYDALGREIKSGVKRFNGAWQWTNREYDGRGRLSRVSLPYRQTSGSGDPSYWNTYHYDLYDRPDSLCEASGRVTRWSYNGTSTTTVKDSIAITKTTDAMGRVVSFSDLGGTTTYTLRDDGQPSSITAPGNVVTTFTYDDYGRQIQMTDPSLGTETDSYTWNADGSSQFTHTNRNGTVTTYKDKYGRTTQVQRANEFNTTYTYDTYGRLNSVSSTNSTGKEYTYDSYDRVSTVKEFVPYNKWLQKTYTYSTGSVLSSIAYTSQSGYITTETYTYANGHNTGITIPNNITVWSLVSENDLGQPTEITTGGISREYGYTAFGLPTYRKMDDGYIQNFSFQFDPKTGNLLQRSGYIYNYTETFGYDGLNRLTGITKGNTTREIVYADNGNITSIDGVGTLIYGGSSGVSPYEVTGLTPEQGQPAYRQRTVTYNSFDRPSYVMENTDDYPEAWYTYNADGERVFADIQHVDGFLHWQAYAGGRYEHDSFYGFVTERLYLGGDAYSAPMVLQKAPGGNWTLYNIGRDYLGSVTSISTSGGDIIAQYRYDPWGRIVDPSTGTPYAPGSEPALFLGRGFTSHEHLTYLGLIYANARLYDPLLGRFLSPDPYVQDPDFSQNYNRYSYCLNNPLKYTDESGCLWTFATATLRLPDTIVKAFVVPYFVGFWDPGKAGRMTDRALTNYKNLVSNAFEIDLGLYYSDSNKDLPARILEIYSRFTWQIRQTVVGYSAAGVANLLSGVKSVSKYGGTTVIETYSSSLGAVALGNYILGEKGIYADPSNYLFQHEYGHYIQSQVSGPAYFVRYGIPSALSNHDHDFHPVEQDANKRAFEYFSRHVKGFNRINPITGNYDGDWDWDKNPIGGLKGNDYLDPNYSGVLNQRLTPSWTDYSIGCISLLGSLLLGAIHGAIDNLSY